VGTNRAITTEKEEDQTAYLVKQRNLGWCLLSTENGCNWCDLPRDLPPYSTVFWHFLQWRSDGIIEQMMIILHRQVREQVKKNKIGQGC